jgi:hypothetical protein
MKVHTITVPAKYKRHARRYIEGYMTGYLKAHEKHAAKRALEGASAQLGAAPSRNKKDSHTEADYRQHGTAERHCARCLMYEGLNKCSAVEAPISPQAVCKYFKAKVSRLMTRLRKGVDE